MELLIRYTTFLQVFFRFTRHSSFILKSCPKLLVASAVKVAQPTELRITLGGIHAEKCASKFSLWNAATNPKVELFFENDV